MGEILDFESEALGALTWESATDVARPNRSNPLGPREIALVTGLPLYIFSYKQTRDSLRVPHRRIQKLIPFDCDEMMAWAKCWSQCAKNQGIDVRADPASQYRFSQQPLVSLPA